MCKANPELQLEVRLLLILLDGHFSVPTPNLKNKMGLNPVGG